MSKHFRLLMFNLKVDKSDPILGFTTAWIDELARYADQIDVITMQTGEVNVPKHVNVYSVGREKGYSEARRAINFYRKLGRLIVTQQYDACFAHMMPLFAMMGGGMVRLRGLPMTLWYTHRQLTHQLQWATRLSNRVVSAVPSSFPIETPKLRALGHGIDTDVFVNNSMVEKLSRPTIVQVARLMPIKHQHILLEATKDLDADIVFIGDVPDSISDDYFNQLKSKVDEFGMSQRVTFAGRQSREQVIHWYQQATIAVNLSPVGLFDKAALESMACCIPTVVSNPAFDDLLGDQKALMRIDSPDDVDGLRTCLKSLLAMSDNGRGRIGSMLRRNVVAQHSLQALVPKLINVLRMGEIE